jgi:transposase
MISIPSDAKCFLLPFKRGQNLEDELDGLVATCRESGFDPFNGDYFVFTQPKRSRVGVLFFDGQGFVWTIKRYSTGSMEWWPKIKGNEILEITGEKLMELLNRGENFR